MESDPGIPETPTVPAELTGQLPRTTRLTGNGIMTVISATVLLLVGLVGSLNIGIHATRLTQQETLTRAGSETTGEIKRVWFAGRSHVPRISYAFAANGESFAGKARVPKQLLHTVESSNTLRIRYLPGNPAVNHPAAWKASLPLGWEAVIVPFIISAAVGVLILLLLRRQRQLLAKGAPALAVVTKCSRSRSGFWVRYEFRVGGGTVTEGAGWCKSQQQIGAKIRVLHMPQNPRRSRPYPLPAIRVALP